MCCTPGSHLSTETADTWTVSNLSASDPNCFHWNEGSKRHLSLRDFWGHSVNCRDRSEDTLVCGWHLEDTSLLTGTYRCKGLTHRCCHQQLFLIGFNDFITAEGRSLCSHPLHTTLNIRMYTNRQYGYFWKNRWTSYIQLQHLKLMITCSCPFIELRSSAFFSRDWTHTFLFCLQREAAALLRSRNLRRFSSGSSLVVLRLRPPVLGGFGAGGAGETWEWTDKIMMKHF